MEGFCIMKRLFFVLLFALTALFFTGCSDAGGDSSGITPTSVEPDYLFAPVEYYAPLTSSQRTSYVTDLRSNGFDLEEEDYSKSTGSMYLFASLEQYSGNNYCLILFAFQNSSSHFSMPVSEFPAIPLGVAKTAVGNTKLYEGNAAGYFLYLRKKHIADGDERYVIDGDEVFCADRGATLLCSSYDVDDVGYTSTTLDMDKAFFQAISE
jgi:hypothetical protein